MNIIQSNYDQILLMQKSFYVNIMIAN